MNDRAAPGVTPEQRAYVDAVARLGVRNLPPGGAATVTKMIAMLPPSPRSIIDLGCNTGWVAAEVARARPGSMVIGIDVSANMVAAARRQHLAVLDAPKNLDFVEMDVAVMDRHFEGLEAALCAGSGAFFQDPEGAYSAVARALGPRGVLLDAHYVYEPTVPEPISDRERACFGVVSTPRSTAECVDRYEHTGLVIRSYERGAQFFLENAPHAALYRSILARVPGLASVVDEMILRRDLINALACHRYPALLTLDHGQSGDETGTADVSYEEAARVMDLFSTPFRPRPLREIRALLPHEFLAYVGDPDAAPGGAASVKRAALLLRDLGLSEDGAILDVGSFTGMSSFVLAQYFRNVVGIDIEPMFVNAAEILGRALGSRARFQHVDGRCTGLPDSSQDAVVLTATLGYTPEPRSLLSEAFRLLKPSGVLIEFLYHYPVRTGAVRDSVHAAVSAHVRIASLAAQIADIESLGFRLERAERIPRAAGRAEHVAAVCASVLDRERGRNPSLNASDLAEFADLFRHYVGRLRLGDAEPSVYLCCFRTPKRSTEAGPDARGGSITSGASDRGDESACSAGHGTGDTPGKGHARSGAHRFPTGSARERLVPSRRAVAAP